MRKLFKRLFGLGLLAGIGYAVWRYFERERAEPGVGWEAQPFPYPPQPREAPAGAGGPEVAGGEQAWVEPNGDTCPATHPVKAKMSSKIFHLPGGANYDRTKPDRCYTTSDAAEADGLRASKV